ncbi:hypothetical protein P280DRAFT_467883, partial [Massarina eburnea CBS 473.64]
MKLSWLSLRVTLRFAASSVACQGQHLGQGCLLGVMWDEWAAGWGVGDGKRCG